MLDSINITRSFYETFGHKTGDIKTIPDRKIRELRIDLIQEELHELACATGVEKRFLLNSFKKLFGTHKDKFKEYEEIILELFEILNQDFENETEYNLVETIDATNDLQVVLDGSQMAYGTHIF